MPHHGHDGDHDLLVIPSVDFNFDHYVCNKGHNPTMIVSEDEKKMDIQGANDITGMTPIMA